MYSENLAIERVIDSQKDDICLVLFSGQYNLSLERINSHLNQNEFFYDFVKEASKIEGFDLIHESKSNGFVSSILNQYASVGIQISVIKQIEQKSNKTIQEFLKPDMFFCHSIGEYGALFASKSIDESIAIQCIHHRWKIFGDMKYKMISLTRPLSNENLISPANACSDDQDVRLVCINSERSAVISCNKSIIEEKLEKYKNLGYVAIQIYNDTNPFHRSECSLLANKYFQKISKLTFNKSKTPIMTSYGPILNEKDAPACLSGSVQSIVNWDSLCKDIKQLQPDRVFSISFDSGFLKITSENLKPIKIADISSL